MCRHAAVALHSNSLNRLSIRLRGLGKDLYPTLNWSSKTAMVSVRSKAVKGHGAASLIPFCFFLSSKKWALMDDNSEELPDF